MQSFPWARLLRQSARGRGSTSLRRQAEPLHSHRLTIALTIARNCVRLCLGQQGKVNLPGGSAAVRTWKAELAESPELWAGIPAATRGNIPGETVAGGDRFGGGRCRRNKRALPSGTVPWMPFESAEEVEVYEPYHVALADGRISLTKEVVVYGLYDLVLLDRAVVVGVIAIFQRLL